MATGLAGPYAIAFTPSGSLAYISTDAHILTMPVGGGWYSVLAGSGVLGFADGQGILAKFYGANAFVVHPVTGVIYITDQTNNRVRACTPQGLVSTVVGTGTGGSMDGAALTATFNKPVGIVMDPTSVYLYVACAWGCNVRQVVLSSGYTTTLAGSGAPTSTDGLGLGATLNNPEYVMKADIRKY